jgi:polysaccharide export outer membrane protein
MGGLSLRLAVVLALGVLCGCVATNLPPAPPAGVAPEYVIGPGDKLTIFVWRNPELSADVPVRPDGRISIPLVEDIVASGKTPSMLARDIELRLAKYVSKPIVTVLPKEFVGTFGEQIRVVGEAAQPRALPYRANMTLLDVMIEVGGLTKYAAGDRAKLVRMADGTEQTYGLHIDSLVKDGDIASNIPLLPGDVIIIPQRWF